MVFAAFPSLGLVKRELISSMRRGRTYGMLALFVGGAITLAVVGWPEGQYVFSEAASFSRAFLSVVTAVLFLTCGLFVPAFAASSITLERERRTFDLLQLTLIRPSGIVLGKLMSSVGLFILLTIAAMPVFSVAFFLVGVDLGELTQLVAVVLMSAVTWALISIAISARARRAFTAIALSYLFIVLLLLVAPWILFVFWMLVWAYIALVFPVSSPFPGFGSFLGICSPLATVATILDGDLSISGFWLSMLSQGVVAIVCFYLAVLSLYRVAEVPRVESHKPIDDPAVLKARRSQYPFYLIDPLRRKKPIEDGRNPMLVKEMRWGLINRGTVLARLTYSAVILYFLLGAGTFLESGSYGTMYFWLMSQIVVTVLVAPALLANALTKERELGNIDMLRMTLLTPRQVVLGKLISGALSITPLLLAAFVSAMEAALFLKLHQWALMTAAYGTMIVCCWLCFVLSLLASLLTRRTASAVVFSYFFSFMAFVGLAGVARVLASYAAGPATGIVRGHVAQETVDQVCAFLSPISAFVLTAQPHRGFGRGLSNPISLYWLSNIMVFALICLLLTYFLVRVFQRYHMQDV